MANTSIAVPIYQREYRWEIDACEQLLADIRAVGKGDERQTHFFGSLLHTTTSVGTVNERMLVDGQQRVATLMLLVAALYDRLGSADEEIAGALRRVLLLDPTRTGGTRLRLRQEGARELDGIVFGGPLPDVKAAVSHLRDNYGFFLSEIQGDALEVWDGLQKLEHVAIRLEEHANPQQVFESLNSTGAPLRNHELIHNYVLMGLTYAQQAELEDSFWVPIEQNTGEALDSFLRDYLILRTGRDSDLAGDRGVYNVFKGEFPAPQFESLTAQAEEWKAYSDVYRILLDPAQGAEKDLARQLSYISTFGTAMYPLLLCVYRDYQLHEIDKTALLEILEQLQSLYLRKMVVGASRDHLAAQLCRKRQQYGYPIRTITRRTPSDERVREALKHRPLPHAGYVLHRIDEPGDLELQIEHIFPQFQRDTWSADGNRQWVAFSDVERAKYNEILPTIGNLALLEPGLNAAASNKPFVDKKAFYDRSGVPSTKGLSHTASWDLESISERTRVLTDRFLEIWKRPSGPVTDDPDHLVPILDAERKFGFYEGWRTEFEYAVFHGERWEERNLKTLYKRVFKRLWDTNRTQVLKYSLSHGGPVFQTAEPNRQFDPLPGSHYLFMGLFPQNMLAEIQGLLDELDMADDMCVKYSTDED